MGIQWQDLTTNEEAPERANVKSIKNLLVLRQLTWTGQVSRMHDSRMPKAVVYGELKQGKRDRVAPKKTLQRLAKAPALSCRINHSGWEKLAEDRDEWTASIKRATGHSKD